MQGNDLGQAIDLFAKVLQTRIAKYGGLCFQPQLAQIRVSEAFFYSSRTDETAIYLSHNTLFACHHVHASQVISKTSTTALQALRYPC